MLGLLKNALNFPSLGVTRKAKIDYLSIFMSLNLRLLSVENKCDLAAEAVCSLFRRKPKEFLHRHITANATWVPFYTSEIKAQSKSVFLKAIQLWRRRSQPTKWLRIITASIVLDLCPWHFFLFPNIEKWLCGKQFLSDEEDTLKTVVCLMEGFKT